MDSISRYRTMSRAEWAALRASTPLPLSEDELASLRGINEAVSLAEVEDVYLPLSRLLNLRVAAAQALSRATEQFLGQLPHHAPFIIGIAGSVAVGKSTTARILQALLARWPDHPTVELVTTDGFLLPNEELEALGFMDRKGFPESYDVRRLLHVLADLKSGVEEIDIPLYSHVFYDVMVDEVQVIRQPDIVIVEGLNVLQVEHSLSVSDFFDFSIYVDAPEADIEDWYVERFHTLREAAASSSTAFFNRFSSMDTDEATSFAQMVWGSINRPNLLDNILPTRERAHLVLVKARDHSIDQIRLRLR